MTTPELADNLRVDRATFDRHMRDFRPARWVKPVLRGAHLLPAGPALFVGNHGPLGFDTPLLVHALYRDTGRIIRPLADRLFFGNPVGRLMARMTASVEARPDHALALLRAGAWVLVYPGGARETMRASGERYQLSWEGRLGFARVALEAQVPIVPVACVGNDDLFVQVLSKDRVRESLFGQATSRLLGENYVPPLYVPRLRNTQFHYHFGAPIPAPSALASDDAAATALANTAREALEELLTQGRVLRRAKLSRE